MTSFDQVRSPKYLPFESPPPDWLKRAAGRPKDLEAIAELIALQEERDIE